MQGLYHYTVSVLHSVLKYKIRMFKDGTVGCAVVFDGGHLNPAVWRARLCYNTGHFPLGNLVMGKNVFCQINDMFIQKEVAALFRSSVVSKFERKNENEWDGESESDSECEPSVLLFVTKAKTKKKEPRAPL